MRLLLIVLYLFLFFFFFFTGYPVRCFVWRGPGLVSVVSVYCDYEIDGTIGIFCVSVAALKKIVKADPSLATHVKDGTLSAAN